MWCVCGRLTNKHFLRNKNDARLATVGTKSVGLEAVCVHVCVRGSYYTGLPINELGVKCLSVLVSINTSTGANLVTLTLI